MFKLIKDYVLPASTVTMNGVLCYFINQLRPIKADLDNGTNGLSQTSILGITLSCITVLCILTYVEKKSSENSIQSNIGSQFKKVQSNWIGGLLLFLVVAVIYGLLLFNIIPQESRTEFRNISLILCGFGAIIPSFLLIPKWWQNIFLLVSSGIGIFLTWHYLHFDNSNAAFLSFFFTLISIILLTARDFFVKAIKPVAQLWEDS